MGLSHDSSIHQMRVYGRGYPRLVYSANDSIIQHREVISRLGLYNETAVELHRYRHGRIGFYLLMDAALGSVISGIAVGHHGNRVVAWSFVGAALVAYMGALSTRMTAALHLRKAIVIYNRRFVP